jgi:hypothetical protein
MARTRGRENKAHDFQPRLDPAANVEVDLVARTATPIDCDANARSWLNVGNFGTNHGDSCVASGLHPPCLDGS